MDSGTASVPVLTNTSTGTSTSTAEVRRLRNEIADLSALANGDAPKFFPVAALFETDLIDDEAVAKRVEVLRTRVATSRVDGSTHSEDARADLLLERDGLRLAFLGRPNAERGAAIDADRRRRKIAEEQAATERERLAAADAERASELARQQALEVARLDENQARREIAGEQARVAAERAALASLKRTRAEARQRELEIEAARREQVDDLIRRAGKPTLSGPEADLAYDEIVSLLAGIRGQLGIQLAASPIKEGADFKLQIDPDGAAYVGTPVERKSLLAELAKLRAESAGFELEERERRYARDADLVDELTGLNELRIGLLEQLTVDKRSDVLGLTRNGLAQLEREVRHLVLMARWYPEAKARDLRRVPELLGDAFVLGRLSLKTGGAIALLVVLWLARRRHAAWIEVARARGVALVRSRALRLWLERWSLALAAVVWPAALLVGTYVLFDGLVGAQAGTELGVARDLAIAIGWYRLGIATFHHALTSIADFVRGSVSRLQSDKLLRSVRVIGRYVLVVVIFLLLARAILGRGYLYRWVVGLAWVGALPMAYVLLRWWRADIVSAYLRAHPTGALAELVERTRDRSVGIFVAAAAFAFVAARGAAIYVRKTLLGFEQTRKALAFLFRRRLEKQREGSVEAETDSATLPAAVVEVFSEAAVAEDNAIDHFPGLEVVEGELRAFRQGGLAGHAIALIGEQGVGKTSWLTALARRAGGGLAIHTIEARITTEGEVCRMICGALGIQEVGDRSTLIERLVAGPRQIVLLDLCQNLLLRSVGGFDGYRAFAEIVSRTRDHLFWVCAFAKRPYELVRRVEIGTDVYAREIALGPWSEEQISTLIEGRMKAAGLVAAYDDLIVERLEGTELSSEVVRTASSFLRLLWDYADGNPRVAIHFWLRSLTLEGEGRARVQLFAAPKVEALDLLEERTCFVLAALVQHENITAAETAGFLRYSVSECTATLALLVQHGYCVERAGRHRLTTRWYRAILRFLRRKNLLFT